MFRAKRFISVATLVAFVLVIAFSSFFVIFCSNHNCCGDGCFICRFINECVANHVKFSATFALLLTFAAASFLFFFFKNGSFSHFHARTPVSLCDKIIC